MDLITFDQNKNILLIGKNPNSLIINCNILDINNLDISLINFDYDIIIINKIKNKNIIKIIDYFFHNNLVLYLLEIDKFVLNKIEIKFIFKKQIDNLIILSN